MRKEVSVGSDLGIQVAVLCGVGDMFTTCNGSCQAELLEVYTVPKITDFPGTITATRTQPNPWCAVELSDHLPGVFKGPGDGTLKF